MNEVGQNVRGEDDPVAAPSSWAGEGVGSPVGVAMDRRIGVSLPCADYGRRLAAFLIDAAIGLALSLGLLGIAFLAGNAVLPAFANWGAAVYVVLVAVMVIAALAPLGVFLLYFPILEGTWGRTVGKWVLGLRVVKDSGAPIGFGEAFVRRLSFYCLLLPVDAAFVFFTTRRQRALDLLAHTVVVAE